MTRKIDLILAILEWLERQPNTWAELPRTLDGYPEDVVQYHVQMCIGAGFVHKGAEIRYTQLTWAGHEKLDELRTATDEATPAWPLRDSSQAR